MKPSSPAPASKLPDRSTAINCVIINQFATPGLGSILARRYLAGAGQLMVALVGFGLLIGWFFQLFLKMYRLVNDQPVGTETHNELAKAGAAIFAFAWLWAACTSLSVWRAARRQAREDLNLPPRLK